MIFTFLLSVPVIRILDYYLSYVEYTAVIRYNYRSFHFISCHETYPFLSGAVSGLYGTRDCQFGCLAWKRLTQIGRLMWYIAGFEVTKEVTMMSTISCDVTLCQTFRKDLQPPTSWSKSRRMRQAARMVPHTANILLMACFAYDPEDGGGMFLETSTNLYLPVPRWFLALFTL
jgi:hypothetical protein